MTYETIENILRLVDRSWLCLAQRQSPSQIFSKHPLQRNLIYQTVNLRLVIHLFLGWASFYLPSFQDN